jgi:hypothetical protein
MTFRFFDRYVKDCKHGMLPSLATSFIHSIGVIDMGFSSIQLQE